MADDKNNSKLSTPVRPGTTTRVTTTLSSDDYERLKYWAASHEMSVNEYIRAAILFKIQWDNKDYPMAPMEVHRLNQLVDVITVLSSNVRSLEQVTVSGFDSLLGLTRGDNYLLEEEDGEL